jgi:hypothetical protein
MTDFAASRTVHEFTQTNLAPPERVFPLLCPVREAEWAPGWKYRLIFSHSGFAEPGCVFATPNENGAETVWAVTHYDRERFQIYFHWVWPERMMAQIEIVLQAHGPEETLAHIRYTYTGISEAGNRRLARQDAAWFSSMMREWEAAINHFLTTGRKIEREE